MAARTTISLSEPTMRRLRRYAESRSLGLSRALEDLIVRALEPPLAGQSANKRGPLSPWPLPPDSPRVTSARVRQLENDPE